MENSNKKVSSKFAIVTGGVGRPDEQKHECFHFRAYGIDVLDFTSCKNGVAKIVADMEPFDVMVNDAGVTAACITGTNQLLTTVSL